MFFETLKMNYRPTCTRKDTYIRRSCEQSMHKFNLLATGDIIKKYAEWGQTEVSISGYNNLS